MAGDHILIVMYSSVVKLKSNVVDEVIPPAFRSTTFVAPPTPPDWKFVHDTWYTEPGGA